MSALDEYREMRGKASSHILRAADAAVAELEALLEERTRDVAHEHAQVERWKEEYQAFRGCAEMYKAALEEREFQAATKSDKDRIAQLEDAIRLHEDWYEQMRDVADFWMKKAEHYKRKAEE